MHTHRSSFLLVGLLSLVTHSLAGCSTYQLQGIVVEGPRPGVYLVNADDVRLNNTAVADARIDVMLDPQTLREKILPSTLTNEYGKFAIPIDEPGAGLLEYTVALYTAADGYADQGIDKMKLPGKSEMVLIVVAAGRGSKPRQTGTSEDLLKEADKFKKQFE